MNLLQQTILFMFGFFLLSWLVIVPFVNWILEVNKRTKKQYGK